MRQRPETKRSHGEKVVKDIRRATRKQYSAEDKIRIVLGSLKGELACCRFRGHRDKVFMKLENLYGEKDV